MALRRITIRAFTARRKNSPKPVRKTAPSARIAATARTATSVSIAPSRPRQDGRSADGEDGREDRRPRMNGGDDSLPLDVLPPAIGREPPEQEAETSDDQPRRPRRRARTPRATDGDDEIAPAA